MAEVVCTWRSADRLRADATTARGAIPALPERAQVERFLREHGGSSVDEISGRPAAGRSVLVNERQAGSQNHPPAILRPD